MKILIVDNYDSFTWNLYHYLEQLSDRVDVFRNDDERCLSTDDYDGIVISPGPGLPVDSGMSETVIGKVTGRVPLLGICLGHQAIVEYFGGSLVNLASVLHGRQCVTNLLDKSAVLFRGFPESFETGHYHSWVADPENMPEEIKVTAADESGNIMAIEHRTFQISGVQFHPESVMTPLGFGMIENWVKQMRVESIKTY